MDETTPAAIQALLEQLRQEFLADLPNRIDTIERLILDDHADGNELCRQVHSLKGLGGTHGIDILSFACHQFEEALATTSGAMPAERRAALLAYVDILRQIRNPDTRAGQSDESIREALDALRQGDLTGQASLLLVEPSATMTALLQERLATLPVNIDVIDDGLAALDRFLHRRHDIVITAGEPRRLGGAALIAAIRQYHDSTLCLLVTAYGNLTRADSGGADHVLQRDRNLPDRLHYLLTRHLGDVPPSGT